MAGVRTPQRLKYQADWFSEKYRTEEAFREAEKARKAVWYQKNRERLIQKVLDARAAKKKK
jgi:hypothetical protein